MLTLSKQAQEILVSQRFLPSVAGYLIPSFLADQLDCNVDEVSSWLTDLEKCGFLQREDQGRLESEPRFRTTILGWRRSEQLRRELRMRRQALLDQSAYKLNDLIVAICYEPHARNERLRGGMLGASPIVPIASLFIYLQDWTEEQIRNACDELEALGLIKASETKIRELPADGVHLTERGKKEYRTRVQPTLHLASKECILDPPPPNLTIFFAWQSEYKPSRNILSDVVPAVVSELNAQSDLLRPLELVQATEAGEGALRIDVALQEKIKHADYFIGDLTPVYAYKSRLRVNENVLVETGYALASKPSSRIILAAMNGHSVEGDGAPNPQPAFDIGHVRRLRFERKSDAKSKIASELRAMLNTDGWFKKS